jgi:asparagine synthase (glutamine-hydrolysing)
MCAINGIVGDETLALEIMLAKTKHRGPDATGHFYSEGISLGHNRLSILDPTERSNQPFKSTDGRYLLVFNGEIYNYRELRKEIKNYSFVTDSDTEVLLALLLQDGEEAIGRLNGIFSFALWDCKKRELLLVRDQLGVKPLYYSLQNNNLYFSSELTAISAGSDLRKIHTQALTSYLFLGYSLGEETLVTGIKKLKAGHLIRYSENNLSLTQNRYWNPSSDKKKHTSHKKIRDTIDTAVARQLVSDRPLGLTLSGGLDSSIVLHHAQKRDSNIQTFSSSFELTEQIGKKYNQDAELASRTAKIYGVPHTTLEIPAKEISNGLEEILGNQSDPIANPTSVTRNLLYKLIRDRGIVVVLGGDGGDELFGGYSRYQRVLAAKYFQKLPGFVRTGATKLHPRFADLNLPLDTNMHLRLVAQPAKDILLALKNKEYIDYSELETLFGEYYESAKHVSDPVDRFMQVDRETWLAEESLLQTDINSMRHALEARVPLLDTSVVTLADEMSAKTKFNLRISKKILRDAYKNQLPSFLFDEPKRGWQSPAAKWLRDPAIQEFVREAFSSSYYNGLDSLFDWNAVQTMYTEHIEQKNYYLYPLWNILQLQIWAKKNNLSI